MAQNTEKKNGSSQLVSVGLNAVVIAAKEKTPQVLVIHPHGEAGIPSGLFDVEEHRTLELGLRHWVESQTGLKVGYVEQLYTFGNRYRDAEEIDGGKRVISVGYLTLARDVHQLSNKEACWENWYHYFPWEDWRKEKPAIIDEVILPRLEEWVEQAKQSDQKDLRRERVALTFKCDKKTWDVERVLERYELLYDAGLILEAHRDNEAWKKNNQQSPAISNKNMNQASLKKDAEKMGAMMMLDHRRILATAMARIRGKIKYRPVVFELLPEKFRLFDLQQVVEALSGVSVHKQNFRRLLLNTKLVEEIGEMSDSKVGRPAALYRFRKEIVRERPAPGVGLPR